MPAIAVAVGAAAAGSAVVGALGGAAVLGTLGAALVAAGTAAVVGSVLTRALVKPQAPQQFEEQARGILLNVPANDAPLPVVYGLRRAGGVTSLLEATSGSAGNNEFLQKIVAISEGEVDRFGHVYLDGEISTSARLVAARIIETYVGTDTQAASAHLQTQLSSWTSAHQGKGVAYVYAQFTSFAAEWRGEPAITADVFGRKLYDPRVAGSPTVYRFSNNAALVIRDYLTNTRYGRGIPEAALDEASFIAAANTCDERVSVPTFSQGFTVVSGDNELTLDANTPIGLADGVQVASSGSLPSGLAAATTYYFIPTGDATGRLATSAANALAGTVIDLTSDGTGTLTISHIDQARYTIDGLVDTSRPPLDNLRELLTACRGYLVFSGGTYKLGVDGAAAATGFIFNEDNIVGGWQIAPASKRNRFNRVTAKFFNPARQWQPDFALQDSSTFRTEDNGRLLETEVSLPYTANVYRAARIAQLEMRQSRVGTVARFRATVAAVRCEVGDVVEITHSTPGWTLKKFRITGMVLRSDDEVEISAREYDVGVYSLDALSAVRTAPATNLPNPFDDVDVTGLTASSGTADLFVNGDGTVVPRIRLRWTEPDNAFLDYYEVQYARSSGSPQEWVDVPDVVGPASEAFVHPVEDGVSYDCRIRAVTSLGNRGAWACVYGHTVAGKTEVPSDVAGATAVQTGGLVVMGCNMVSDADLDAVEVRLHDEGETDYDNATPVAFILRGETVTSAALPPGTWELLFKAKDTSGNYSANAARVTIAVTADGFTTLEQEAQAPKWMGTFTNMVKHWTGVLTPDSQSLASALGWEVFDEYVPNAYVDCYYEAALIDKGIDAVARIYGDIVSVLGPGETTGVTAPKFEVDTRLAAGSFDGFETWSVGSANFRYLRARIHVETAVGKPVISQFTPTIDKQAFTQTGTLTVGAGGSGSATFSIQFHSMPALQVTPQGTGDVTASYANLTSSGFDGYFKSGGSAAAGTMQYSATGA